MCNACGFYCCAYDGFGQCGCEFCPEPECRDIEEDDYFDDDDYGYDCCARPSRFVCEEVKP